MRCIAADQRCQARKRALSALGRNTGRWKAAEAATYNNYEAMRSCSLHLGTACHGEIIRFLVKVVKGPDGDHVNTQIVLRLTAEFVLAHPP